MVWVPNSAVVADVALVLMVVWVSVVWVWVLVVGVVVVPWWCMVGVLVVAVVL